DDARSPMARLARRLALRPAQVELLWTVVACSVDGRLVSHLEALGGAHARRGLSPSVYAMLAELDDDSVAQLAHWLAAGNPLVATGLVIAAEPASPAARAYVAAAPLVSYLLGDDVVGEPLLEVHAPAALLHDRDQRQTLAEIAAVLGRGAESVIVIEGPLGSGRITAAAHASGAPLIVLDLAQLATEQLGDALIALRRETLLRPGIPAIANVDHALGDDRRDQRRMISQLIDAMAGPLVVTSTVPGIDLGTRRAVVRLRWDVADRDVRAALWRREVAASGGTIDGDVTILAHRYRVGPAAIQRAIASLRLLPAGDAPLGEAALAAGLRHNIAERLGGLAQRVEVTQTWDDLVLAEDTCDLIAALLGRVRHAHQVLDTWGYRRKIARGAGVAALFSGPPGTGKTMVAGLLARELDLELYQVDLSKVVSKWVGETEKNLALVFDAAEEGHALLLFDEADALFGQRSTEMKSAVDRYANLEVNYLLQRVEAFGGITVLTTNLETAIDTALKRRLASHIVFAAPEEDERRQLWRCQITTGTAPLARDVDPEDLARAFPAMSGANIRNAAVSAAFLAAADGAAHITQEHLIRASRAEYRSMGHMVSEAIASRSTLRRKP
ncbi:MAG: AAA family ATPase, partial [Kofleriaceae bacterium]